MMQGPAPLIGRETAQMSRDQLGKKGIGEVDLEFTKPVLNPWGPNGGRSRYPRLCVLTRDMEFARRCKSNTEEAVG